MSLGREALRLGIGDVHVCFRFLDPKKAKRAWEKVSTRTTGVSVNRFADTQGLDPTRVDPERVAQFVIVATDSADGEKAQRQIAIARTVLARAGGYEVDPPPMVAEITAANRARNIAEGDGRRKVVRTPMGAYIDEDGITHGYRGGHG